MPEAIPLDADDDPLRWEDYGDRDLEVTFVTCAVCKCRYERGDHHWCVDALRAEVARMSPVVEAACEMRDMLVSRSLKLAYSVHGFEQQREVVLDAVDAYREASNG